MGIFKPLINDGITTDDQGMEYNKLVFTDGLTASGTSDGTLVVSYEGGDSTVAGASLITTSSSEYESSTTNKNYVTKTSLAVTDLPSGEYRIDWYYEYSASKTNKTVYYCIYLNGAQVIAENNTKLAKIADYNALPVSGFYDFNYSGNLNVALLYCTSDKKTAAYISRARLSLWRTK